MAVSSSLAGLLAAGRERYFFAASASGVALERRQWLLRGLSSRFGTPSFPLCVSLSSSRCGANNIFLCMAVCNDGDGIDPISMAADLEGAFQGVVKSPHQHERGNYIRFAVLLASVPRESVVLDEEVHLQVEREGGRQWRI